MEIMTLDSSCVDGFMLYNLLIGMQTKNRHVVVNECCCKLCGKLEFENYQRISVFVSILVGKTCIDWKR